MEKNSVKSADHQFLSGGGEMGKLIRAKDWSKTPLGDPSTWPQSLRTMVSVMLDNPFGMYIAWGKEYIQIYNDGYRPILGATKHPQALGISSKETFAEIWHIIESMFDGVMNGVPVGFPDFMLPLERNGYVETCYFDFAYSPIRMENGVVGGVLVTVIETTGKKKAVEDLKESEDRFRNMAENTNIYIAVGDESSNATYFNNAWVKLTGRPVEELLEFGWLDLVHPDDRDQYVNVYLDAFKKREAFTGEFRVLNSEGEYRWLLANGPPRFRPDGSFAGYISSCVDITEQKMVEIELKESKDQLLFAIDAAELGTWDYNPITDYFSANTRLKEWFGLPKNGEIELSDALNVIEDTDRDRVTEAIQNAMQYDSRGIYDVEYTIVNPVSKKSMIVHAKGRAWFNENKIAYRLNGTLEDITEQTIADRKTKESEQHIRTMVLEAPIGICVMDASTLVSEIVNDSFLEIAGKPYEDIVGKFYWESFAEAREYYEEPLNKVVQTGEPFYANEVELMLIRHNKEEIVYVTFVYAPLKDGNGKVVKVAVWVLENTQQVEARKKIMISENNLKLMILQAPMAISILRGKDFKVEIANKYALELWGRTEEQVLNRSIFESMPELSTQGIREILDEVTSTGNRFATAELPIQLVRNGVLETIYINFSYEALYDVEGKINGVMAIGFDVSAQVISRQKVEESEQNTRNLVASAPFPIAVYAGDEMRIALANQSIMDIWGKGNNVVGKLYPEVLPELENQKIFEQVQKVLKTGKPFHAVNQKVDLEKKGELKPYYFNYSFTPLLDVSGNVYAVMNTAAEVTELHEAKQKVEESEKKFRDSVRQAPLGIAIFRGPENITEMANDNYLLLVDKTENQFVGKPLFETLPEVKEAIEPIISEIFKTGNAYFGYEFPVELNRYGKIETTYFNFVYQPLKENNSISGFMVVATEVTAIVKAKHLLEESEEKLRIVIDASELGMWEYNLKTKEIIASERCSEILGFRLQNDAIHNQLLSNVHPDDVKLGEEAFEKALIDGYLSVGIRVLRKGKSINWVETKGKVFYDADNKPERLLGTIRDISEERNFQHALLEREQKFRLLADSMPQHIWTADPDGNLNYFNQSVYDYSGLSPDQIDKNSWLQIIHPDDRAENIRLWTKSVSTGKDFLFEHRFKRYDGEYRWQLSRAIPQRDAEGQIQMWVGSSTDIQNIKEQEQQKDFFISMASHELKTPLTSIKGYVQILQSMQSDSEDSFLQTAITSMDRQIVTLTKLITELLDISKIKSGGLELNMEKFEIVDLIREVVTEIKHINPDYDIPVTIESKAIVYADKERISQVLINFLTNAVKYAPESKTILVNCSVSNNTVKVSIQDFGIGISKNDQERIFERFYRVEGRNEKTFPGFGIGLFIAAEVIKKHNGTIGLTSEFGKGSLFSFELPVTA